MLANFINQTLSENGLTDKAYNLLLQRDCPSWLYSVDQGATTTWERWDSYRRDKGFGDYSMNSFNHYAYGAVAEWLYSSVAGIDTDESAPGFSHIILRPSPDTRASLPAGQERISSVSATYNSVHGMIASAWKMDSEFEYSVEIPANTNATLYFPAAADDEIYEGGVPVEKADGIEYSGHNGECAVFKLGSGKYTFTRKDGAGISAPKATDSNKLCIYPNPASTIINLVSDEEPKDITIYDMNGKPIIAIDGNCATIDVSGLSKGVYLIQSTTDNAVLSTKLIKL